MLSPCGVLINQVIIYNFTVFWPLFDKDINIKFIKLCEWWLTRWGHRNAANIKPLNSTIKHDEESSHEERV